MFNDLFLNYSLYTVLINYYFVFTYLIRRIKVMFSCFMSNKF